MLEEQHLHKETLQTREPGGAEQTLRMLEEQHSHQETLQTLEPGGAEQKLWILEEQTLWTLDEQHPHLGHCGPG